MVLSPQFLDFVFVHDFQTFNFFRKLNIETETDPVQCEEIIQFSTIILYDQAIKASTRDYTIMLEFHSYYEEIAVKHPNLNISIPFYFQ